MKYYQQRKSSIYIVLSLYKSANGLFGDDFAKESRKTIALGETLTHFVNFANIMVTFWVTFFAKTF